MLGLDELGLTPNQMSEVNAADPTLVAEWLQAASGLGINSPTGFFLSGLRSGLSPHVVIDASRARAVRTAERWIVNAGVHCDVSSSIVEELFIGVSAQLARWSDDDELRARMVALWRRERPRGERCEREAAERAARYVAARKRMEESK